MSNRTDGRGDVIARAQPFSKPAESAPSDLTESGEMILGGPNMQAAMDKESAPAPREEDALDWLLNYCEARQYGNGADWHEVEAARKALADLRTQLSAERERVVHRFDDLVEYNGQLTARAKTAESALADAQARIKALEAELTTPILVATNRLADSLADARKENERLRDVLQSARIELWKRLIMPAFSWIIRDIDKALSSPPSIKEATKE